MGYPIFVSLRGFDVPQVAAQLNVYRQAWQEASHMGHGNVFLRIPVYVAASPERAYTEPQASIMRSYQRLAKQFADSICVMEAGKIVERGTVNEIFDSPKEAYTQRLLSAIPSLAPAVQALLAQSLP